MAAPDPTKKHKFDEKDDGVDYWQNNFQAIEFCLLSTFDSQETVAITTDQNRFALIVVPVVVED